MDDLLSEFLIETSDRLAQLDGEISRFPLEPGSSKTQAQLADLFHTIKGTSRFLMLGRLEALAVSAEDLVVRMHASSVSPSQAAGAVIIEAIDVVRRILRSLATSGVELAGDDTALLAKLRSVPVSAPSPEISPQSETLRRSMPEPEPRPDVVLPPPRSSALVPTTDNQPQTSVSLPGVVSNVSLPVERLESFAGLVGQLVQSRNNLMHLMRDRDDAELEDSIQRLSHITSDLGNHVVATRRQVLGPSAGVTSDGFDIVTAITVSCGGRRFAIPQRCVLELVWVTPSGGMGIVNDEFRYLRLRDKRHPWIRLSTILGLAMDRALTRRREIVIMMQAGEGTFGLSVEQVFDAEEVVMRPQPPLLASIELYSGNTILGDGSVALMLDPAGILAELHNRQHRLIGERVAAALPADK